MLNYYPASGSVFWVYNKTNLSSNDIEERFGPNHYLPYKVFVNDVENTEETIIYSFFDYLQNVQKQDNISRGVVILGCSMPYGIGLDDNQTFSFKFAQKTKRVIYNLAIPGGGINQVLYLFDKVNIKKYIKEEPDYILYFYNPDHLRRMFVYCTSSLRDKNFVIYKMKNKQLFYKPNISYENSWIYSLLFNEIDYKQANFISEKYSEYAEDLFLLYLNTINQKIKTIYPNAKFVIVNFTTPTFKTDLSELYNVIDILNLTGIDVLFNDKENISKYCVDDNFHPNEKYWDDVLPILVDELYKI